MRRTQDSSVRAPPGPPEAPEPDAPSHARRGTVGTGPEIEQGATARTFEGDDASRLSDLEEEIGRISIEIEGVTKDVRAATAEPNRADRSARLRDLNREIKRIRVRARSVANAVHSGKVKARRRAAAAGRVPGEEAAEGGGPAKVAAPFRDLSREIKRLRAEIRKLASAARRALREVDRREGAATARQPVEVERHRRTKRAATSGSPRPRPADRAPLTAPAREPRTGTPALRRQIAIAAALIVIASVAGLIAGGWTADDAGSAPAPDRGPAVADYGRALHREVGELAAHRAKDLRLLRQARTDDDQASAIRNLAAAHRRAASSLEPAPVPARLQPSSESLVDDLRSVAGAYRRLAEGAAAGSPAAYAAGQAAVRRAEANLRQSLRAIGGQPR